MEKCVFNRGKKCAAISPKKCTNCAFRKTEAELMAGREKALERLKTLPPAQYEAIMKKYYGSLPSEEVEE